MSLTSSTKVSVVLPTYNEADHIATLVNELLTSLPYALEIIVVDDSSTDGTADIVQGIEDDRVILIRRNKRGLASAFHRGIMESSGELICWMDADMSMPVSVLHQLIKALENFDVAIGSRYAEGGFDNRHSLRTFSSRCINGLARLILGGPIKDYDSGFVAIRRTVFDSVTLIPYGYGEYFIEFVYDCYRSGLRLTEIGYHFKDRTAGVSKSFPSLWRFGVTGLHYVVRILTLKIRFLRGGNK